MQPKINKTTIKPLALKHWSSTVGFISSGLLVLLILGLLLPVVSNTSSALSPSDLQTNMPASGSIAVAVPGEATMDVVPTAGGSFSAITTNLQVATTNPTGYALYLHTNDSTNALVNVDQSSNAVVPAVGQAQLGSKLNTNTWGFNLSSTVNEALSLIYQAVPSTLTSPSLSTKASSSDSYYLTFATKLDTSLPAGQYANNVVVSAIANPLYVTGLLNLTYMQDMTSSVCANTIAYDGTDITNRPGNEVSKQLIDIRDGKEYWVAKLADGNCWMTQNLALDLKANQTLTNANTDLNSKTSWVIPTTTETRVPAKETYNDQRIWAARSWNLGKFVLATPINIVSCNTAPISGSNFDDDGTVSAYSGQNIGQNCSNLVDVSGANWQPTFNSSNAPKGTWNGTNYNSSTKKVEPYTYNGPLAVNKTTAEYDAHYLIGNFYQWNAAVAGSGGADIVSTGAESDHNKLVYAQDSICPKGWKLPRTARDIATGVPFNMEKLGFLWLAHTYGYPDNGTASGGPIITEDGVNSWKMLGGQLVTKVKNGVAGTGVSGIAHEDVALSPIYMARSGNVDIGNGIYRGAGYWTIEWSSTAYIHNRGAYQWFLKGDYIIPAHVNGRDGGFNVRCIAK